MPWVNPSSYQPPKMFLNAHMQTFYSALRVVQGVNYVRERIYTPDHDFLDLDWSLNNSRDLVILTHGLEGNSHQAYMLGMVKAFNRNGYSALSWNQRGCSGEMNRKDFFYHSGSSNDLDTVVKHALKSNRFDKIVLVGFSMGGNVTLKYVGERNDSINPKIKAAVAISTPIDLNACAQQVSRQSNRLYFEIFMYSIRQKLKAKEKILSCRVTHYKVKHAQSFKEFDDAYTAPMFGFKNAEDYWTKSSSRSVLTHTAIPTLLINAKDDPLLPPACFPIDLAKESKLFYFEMPDFGGHVGFVSFNRNGEFWSESRAVEFANAA